MGKRTCLESVQTAWKDGKAEFRETRLGQWLEKRFPGSELGVATAIVVAMFTLCLNLVFLLVATTLHKPGSNGLGILFEGDCRKIDRGNKVAHGVINVLSTVLIDRSNFCMQLLSSPTRKDIDAAHKKRQWADIGIPSFRNVWKGHIGRWRIFWWILLAMGSVPLHLLWNSTVIFSPIAYQYNELTVTDGFVRGLPWNDKDLTPVQFSDEGIGANWPDNLHFLQQDLPNYEKLDNEQCQKKYAQHFVGDQADVVVVTKPAVPDMNTSTVLGGAAAGWGPWPYQWLCPPESRQSLACYGKLSKAGNNWDFPDYTHPKVDYCLSKKMEKRCRLEYGSLPTILTVVANLLKVVCFVATYWWLKHGAKAQPLITTGDAIASFLEHEDKETLGMSIVEKTDFQNGIWDHRWAQINPMLWRERERCAAFRAIGVSRWIISTILLSAIPLFPSIFLISKVRWLKNDLGLNRDAIQQLGIGNPSGLFLFGVWSGDVQTNQSLSLRGPPSKGVILRNIVLANTPQFALSLAYYVWNSHLTAMIAAREYTEYAAPPIETTGVPQNEPKLSLRITDPLAKTDQRAIHFFTVPFGYWALITILWTALHWLASQAIFFTRVVSLDHWLEISEFSISQVGYSVLGMLCFLSVSLVVFLYGVWISLRSFENRMPLAATCSAALSAACHPKHFDKRHHEKKVHWGVEIPKRENPLAKKESGKKVRRCTFTSGDAHYPDSDRRYA